MAKSQTVDVEESNPLLPSYEPLQRRTQGFLRPWRKLPCHLTLAIIISCTLTVLIVSFFSLSASEPAEFPADGPGIGLALSTYSGSVAIRHNDGNIDNVAIIAASQDYIDLLQRLSRPESKHPSPPYNSFSESISDRPRQWRRALRKRLGYPASSDVAILVPLLQEMVDAAQAYLPSKYQPL